MSLDPYPTEVEIEQIETWGSDLAGLVMFIDSLWWGPKPVYTYDDKRYLDGEEYDGSVFYVLVTHGWSGNEDIISSLRTTLFWQSYWLLSKRGGLFVFKLPPKMENSIPLGSILKVKLSEDRPTHVG